MPNPLRDFLFGTAQSPKRELVEAISPRRSFDDVILPESTRTALHYALNQIRKRELIFGRWGLGERHATGLGLAFNFAGPPGTGKTICAEAIAFALGKKLLLVRYSEMESLWAGETGKNVAAVFHSAREQDAVLFFDEADAIAGKRFANVTQGYQREANTVVNVLLKELEEFDGVVIFATNLAANFDPAFERRVRTHILFEMPGPKERAAIWKVQLHDRKTPVADDVDFDALGEKYEVAGGDIKNAVLKAAQIAASEPGPDVDKKILQRHFIQGMDDVMASRKVMEQSIYDKSGLGDGSHRTSENGGVPANFNPMQALSGLNGEWQRVAEDQQEAAVQLEEMARRIGNVELQANALPGIVERFDDAARERELQRDAHRREELEARLQVLGDEIRNSGREDLEERLQVLATQIRDGQREDMEARLQVLADEIRATQRGDTEERLQVLAEELEGARRRELDERLQALVRELEGARRGELEERLQVLASGIEAKIQAAEEERAREGRELRVHLESKVSEAGGRAEKATLALREQIEAERAGNALAIREQSENSAALFAQAREEWPRQLAAHAQEQNNALREVVQTGLKQNVEPLQAQMQLLAGRVKWAVYSAAAALLATIGAIIAFMRP
jgi:AAA+ superfamily predicted ATPase